MSIRLCSIALFTALPALAADRPPSTPAGGEGFTRESLAHDHEMPAFMRANIELGIAENVARLTREGLLAAPDTSVLVSNLQWPLRARAGYADPDYHGISNFVDLDPAFPNQLLDYQCGTRSYDLSSGYNHPGIDYFLWPFAWRMMDAEVIEVVAAAPGTIIQKIDGWNDRSCTNNYSDSWNAVYVQHGDGTVAWYGHMKLGSLTAKPIGASVAAGEYLGLVASSGFSTGPHLHFELRSSNGAGATIFEPHSGTCRAGASLWANQRPYWDSGINKLATHSAPPSFAVSCPNPGQETPNLSNRFRPGIDNFHVAAYYRDQLNGAQTTFRLRRGNTVTSTWQHTNNGDYAAAYWYWSWTPLPASTMPGVWIVEATFNGRTYYHEYMVGDDIIFASSFGG
ncbi:MAG TPA: peptidoglycan DD-metalloendopeptidase family protein [Dokdonella sp.]|uniref:peptidoglycan DD-metalloendopeptidase family protein n=1 Tax=Dokdonella sp. TaxID=2291710 RepID=UPI0025BEC30F|nr:peptidoglycan DD-metalloendopeptidase family protein [Dokdonella sp.]MBX3691413.1 peptidoglycan DD-metalloendopeptidase family protein [Dokdonella sp.]MCW5567862.1 peptidoglycan DD-metalloendopeptidase family protein [Dokdonella sp.]HNR92285.1 peptidoglycan DD-metalloendopeptidase family protein [Dokdonella sp.]